MIRRIVDDLTGKFMALAIVFGSYKHAGPWVPRMPDLGLKEESRLFPGILSFHLRDQFGINPGVIWTVLQYGKMSPEMPYGYQGTYRSLFLFGDRLTPTLGDRL